MKIFFLTIVSVLLFFFVSGFSNKTLKDMHSESIFLDLTNIRRVGEVDERYQSYNIEMCEVVGDDFWIPYELLDPEKVRSGGFAALKRTISPIDLSGKKIHLLASALGPTYVRVSGTWANTTYFQDDDKPKLSNPSEGCPKDAWVSLRPKMRSLRNG